MSKVRADGISTLCFCKWGRTFAIGYGYGRIFKRRERLCGQRSNQDHQLQASLYSD